jgi:AcrR family transcriptional regulator
MNQQRNARQLPRRTQRERRELSHHRMLDAALALIARQGSSRTTLSQIGEASGYTHGLVSHRFGNKSQLVRTLIQKLQTDFAKSVLPELKGKNGIKALKALSEKYLRATAAHSSRLALYVLIGEALGPVPEIKPELAKADENFRRAIQKIIEDGIRAGEIRATVDARTQAALILATLRGLVIQRILHPDSLDIDTVCRDMKSNLERTLKPAGRRA